MENQDQFQGKLFVTKYAGEFFASIVPTGMDDIDRFMTYIPAGEQTVARMLFTRGFIEESKLFHLVDEGQEFCVNGPLPRVMLMAIMLGLEEVPEDTGEIVIDLASFLDPPGTRKLSQ